YLAYGSNLWPARLAARVGPIVSVGAVRIPAHALSFAKRGADGSGKCTLRPHAHATAWGAVYRVPAAARAVLDRIEGVGHGYAVDWLELPGHGRCFVYLAEPAWLDPDLAPYDWYHALVMAGARRHGFPPAYVSRIRTTVAIRDADRARASLHYALLAAPP
ncbi:MAG: gamma-glutamylcyclotransferase family protein, partial [Gammaproteobacteria bacterium]